VGNLLAFGPIVKLRGIHHITAIASDPQRNVDFYTQILGLRLAKRTVNFDDPSTYHFYFGDRTGRP
jgi:glyoxalase family protein